MPSNTSSAYDVVIIGAGVFGIWTAVHFHRLGLKVAVIEAVGPAHSRASTGGESRVLRCGYGDQDLYTEWACRSLNEWRLLSQRSSLPIFHESGVLWIHQAGQAFFDANAKALQQYQVPFERLTAAQMRQRYPSIKVDKDEAGFYEQLGGTAMARRAIQQLAYELSQTSVDFIFSRVEPIRQQQTSQGQLKFITTQDGQQIAADQVICAAGPWLAVLCPDAMLNKLFITRQEVYFFARDANEAADIPTWADLPFYGVPSYEGRGFKVANDTHGPVSEISQIDRHPSQEGEHIAREFLARRFPKLANRPLTEARVCQYENSSNGDFVIDQHPGINNVWLVGCGSGHGFKHGPALGHYVQQLVMNNCQKIERFCLHHKATQQQREIQ